MVHEFTEPPPPAQENIEASLLRAFLQAVPDIVYFKDCASRFLAASRPKAQRHGFSDPAELIGKTDFDLFGEAHARTAREDEVRIMATGDPIRGKLERLVWPDGAESWVISSKQPLRDLDGRIIGTFGISRDVTRVQRLDAELQDARQELARTAKAARSVEVTNGVLHDVNNAVAAADMSASLLAELIGGLEFPPAMADQKVQLQETTASLKRAVNHMAGIIRAQQTHAAVGRNLEWAEPAALVEDALAITRAPLLEGNIEIRREFTATPPAFVDRHGVLQILVNLLLNARDAMRETSVRRVTVRIEPEAGGGVSVSVIDAGVGITPANLSRLFAHGFTTRADGHGFGLHASHAMARTFGGALTAASDGPGCGATFRLLLPGAETRTELRDDPAT